MIYNIFLILLVTTVAMYMLNKAIALNKKFIGDKMINFVPYKSNNYEVLLHNCNKNSYFVNDLEISYDKNEIKFYIELNENEDVSDVLDFLSETKNANNQFFIIINYIKRNGIIINSSVFNEIRLDCHKCNLGYHDNSNLRHCVRFTFKTTKNNFNLVQMLKEKNT